MTRHNELIAELVAEGWLPAAGWKAAFRRKVLEEPFCGEDGTDGLELSWIFSDARFMPDAYRLIVEGPSEGWGHPVLVLEFAEVVVTNQLPDWKVGLYQDLWWCCDGSGYTHMRLLVVNRYGHRQQVLDLDPDDLEVMLR